MGKLLKKWTSLPNVSSRAPLNNKLRLEPLSMPGPKTQLMLPLVLELVSSLLLSSVCSAASHAALASGTWSSESLRFTPPSFPLVVPPPQLLLRKANEPFDSKSMLIAKVTLNSLLPDEIGVLRQIKLRHR